MEMSEFNLDDLDFEIDEKKIEAMRSGGGEIVEASDDCEGGACKI